MDAPTHTEHVARHLDQLTRLYGQAKTQAVLDRAALHLEGKKLVSGRGGEVGSVECTRYLEAVKDVLGDEVYFPTRINFILARCSCIKRDEL